MEYPLSWTNIPSMGIYPRLGFRDWLKVWISFNQSKCLTPNTLKPLTKRVFYENLFKRKTRKEADHTSIPESSYPFWELKPQTSEHYITGLQKKRLTFKTYHK